MRNYTILLIDYEPRSIERVRRPLTDAGFLVRLATDGVAGISFFEELGPDLVIIEAMIPKKHGFEVCQEIKRTPHGKRTPVLLQTAVYKGRKYRSQALHIYHCDEYLEKPYSDEFLVQTVRNRLGIPPDEVLSLPEPMLESDGPAPAIEVEGPDRPAREPDAVPAAMGSPIPRDPDHPADEEISQKLDDLFSLGVDAPYASSDAPGGAPAVAPASFRGRASAALATLPEDPSPADDLGEGNEPNGELVDFESHRSRKRIGDDRRQETGKDLPAAAAPPAIRRGFPVWVWAGLVGGVAILCYLIFTGTI